MIVDSAGFAHLGDTSASDHRFQVGWLDFTLVVPPEGVKDSRTTFDHSGIRFRYNPKNPLFVESQARELGIAMVQCEPTYASLGLRTQ